CTELYILGTTAPSWTIMGIMLRVGNDERILRQGVISEIAGELRKRNYVCRLSAIAGDVGKVGERIVMLQVPIYVLAGVASPRQTLGISTPGFPGSNQLAHDVIVRHGSRECVIVGDDLARGQHEVISNGRVRVREIVCRQSELTGERVQKRHC